jgi:lysophospholipase L1-like esterase
VSLPDVKRTRTWIVGILVSLLAAAAWASPAGAAAPTYVSLGDSYAAGPLIPLQIPPFGCLKSDHNYAHLAAPQLKYALRDPSCSGAKTNHMTETQNVDPGPNPPQFDSLDANTRLVTLQIGGNDIGFSEIVRNCASTTSPEGHPCQDRYVTANGDEISQRIQATAPKVAAVLQGIHARSPKATVHVVNYLPILPERPLLPGGPEGCWPQVPVAYDDVPYLRAKQKELNQMLADQAAANGARLLDAYTPGIGHDACQLPVIRWVEPTVPASPAAPFHPNLPGMQAEAGLLVAAAR